MLGCATLSFAVANAGAAINANIAAATARVLHLVFSSKFGFIKIFLSFVFRFVLMCCPKYGQELMGVSVFLRNGFLRLVNILIIMFSFLYTKIRKKRYGCIVS